MPRNVIQIGSKSYVLDARPDRIDHRDRPYSPRLISLPPQWPTRRDIEIALPHFRDMVLDQGTEGACTGFGLAAVMNFVFWRDTVLALPRSERGLLAIDLDSVRSPRVSPFQLYHLARTYDEWGGEDYEGSSCRGAVKGFHKHGVCLESLWRDKAAPTGEKKRMAWQNDAATRPLGAYYRIDRLSINDLQAAIHEVGAVYASARIHTGWKAIPEDCDSLPIIQRTSRTPVIGAHAFAIVGYEQRGFLIQNSWGKHYGYHGFVLLPYDDWAKNSMDAWVAVRGAPTVVPTANSMDSGEDAKEKAEKKTEQKSNEPTMSASTLHSYRMDSLATAATRQPGWLWSHNDSEHDLDATQPLSREEAYGLSLVLENDGRVLRRRVGFDSLEDAVNELAFELPSKWFGNHPKLTGGKLRVMIYFHGGLNSEGDSLRRAEVMAPYYLANGIYPIFVTWRTSFLDSIRGILEDSLHRFFQPPTRAESIGWVDAIKEQVNEATDRAIEVACQHLLVKPIWTQMKQNAEAAVGRGSGLAMLLESLDDLFTKHSDCELHLIGHSAGAIPIGHWLQRLERRDFTVNSCRLFAPACTVDFANRTYGRAIDRELIAVKDFYLHVLSDELEQLDHVGPYGKSLLYLISRALEDKHKEPMLGLHWLHEQDAKSIPDDFWFVPPSRRDRERVNPDVETWRSQYLTKLRKQVDVASERFVSDGVTMIPQSHGSFDNQIEIMTDVITQIRGRKANPIVSSLNY